MYLECSYLEIITERGEVSPQSHAEPSPLSAEAEPKVR